jgi:hypothetical protein
MHGFVLGKSKEMNFLVEQFRAHQGVSKVGFLVSP